jgi:hypothetical protein
MKKMECKSHFRDRGKKFVPDRSKKIMEQTKECLRYYHYAYHTEKTYLMWIKRYIKFHGGKTHPRDLGIGTTNGGGHGGAAGGDALLGDF